MRFTFRSPLEYDHAWSCQVIQVTVGFHLTRSIVIQSLSLFIWFNLDVSLNPLIPDLRELLSLVPSVVLSFCGLSRVSRLHLDGKESGIRLGGAGWYHSQMLWLRPQDLLKEEFAAGLHALDPRGNGFPNFRFGYRGLWKLDAPHNHWFPPQKWLMLYDFHHPPKHQVGWKVFWPCVSTFLQVCYYLGPGHPRKVMWHAAWSSRPGTYVSYTSWAFQSDEQVTATIGDPKSTTARRKMADWRNSLSLDIPGTFFWIILFLQINGEFLNNWQREYRDPNQCRFVLDSLKFVV